MAVMGNANFGHLLTQHWFTSAVADYVDDTLYMTLACVTVDFVNIYADQILEVRELWMAWRDYQFWISLDGIHHPANRSYYWAQCGCFLFCDNSCQDRWYSLD